MGKSVDQLLQEQLEELCELNKVLIKAVKSGRGDEENFAENFKTVNESIINLAYVVSGQRDIYSKSIIKRERVAEPEEQVPERQDSEKNKPFKMPNVTVAVHDKKG